MRRRNKVQPVNNLPQYGEQQSLKCAYRRSKQSHRNEVAPYTIGRFPHKRKKTFWRNPVRGIGIGMNQFFKKLEHLILKIRQRLCCSPAKISFWDDIRMTMIIVALKSRQNIQ